MTPAVNETAWLLGFAIAAAVVVIVALVVGTILYLAAQIRQQALAILAALQEARDRTEALWQVQETNYVAEDILAAAQRARAELGG